MELSNLKLDKNTYYFLSPFGIGDTLLLCGLKKEIEKKINGKIYFIIKPSHKIILDMCNIKNFILLEKNQRFSLESEELKILSKKTPTPTKGQIYVAHYLLHSQYKDIIQQQSNKKIFTFLDCYRYFFGLDWDTTLSFPTNSYHTKIRCKIDLDLRKTVLLIPEAHSVASIKREFWQDLAEHIKKKNLLPITSTTNEYIIPGIKNIDMNLEELIALAMNCHSIYSIRNGLCDLLNFKKNLWVIYPDINTYNFNRIKTIFNTSMAREVIWSKDYVF